MEDITSHLERLKESFLWAAAKGGRIQECTSLLELGADVNYTQYDPTYDDDDATTTTPLLVATRNGHEDVVKTLLAHGADATRRDGRGNTALHVAASRGEVELCMLFRDKCSPFCVNGDGMTVVDVAVEKGFFMLAEQLKDMVCPSRDGGGDDGGGGGSRSGEEQADSPRDVETSFERRAAGYGGIFEMEDSREDLNGNTTDNFVNGIRNGGGYQRDLVTSSEDDDDDDSADWEFDPRGGDGYNNNDDSNDEQQKADDNVNRHRSGISSTSSDDDTSRKMESDEDFDEMAMSQFHADDEGRRKSRRAVDNTSRDFMSPKSTCARLAMDLMASESKCVKLRKEKEDLQKQFLALQTETNELSGKSSLEGKSMRELERIENRLRDALRHVVREKERVEERRLAEEEQKRACVVCREEAKCVLLMPCRHLCVCKECSRRNELMRCPLCRVTITQKIDVYS